MQPLGVVDRTYLQRLSSEPLTSLHYCMCTEANAVVHVEIAAATYICTPASMHLYVLTCNANEEVHPRTLIATGLIHSPRWHFFAVPLRPPGPTRPRAIHGFRMTPDRFASGVLDDLGELTRS